MGDRNIAAPDAARAPAVMSPAIRQTRRAVSQPNRISRREQRIRPPSMGTTGRRLNAPIAAEVPARRAQVPPGHRWAKSAPTAASRRLAAGPAAAEAASLSGAMGPHTITAPRAPARIFRTRHPMHLSASRWPASWTRTHSSRIASPRPPSHRYRTAEAARHPGDIRRTPGLSSNGSTPPDQYSPRRSAPRSLQGRPPPRPRRPPPAPGRRWRPGSGQDRNTPSPRPR